MSAMHLLFVAYWMVLLAELAGDKVLYGLTALTARFGVASVACGMSVAFAAKMLVAVWIGRMAGVISTRVMTIGTVVTFAATAIALWRSTNVDEAAPAPSSTRRAAAVTFASLFFTEWGDYGQLTASALAATAGSTTLVWIGGTGALMTKGALAMWCGTSVRRRLSARSVRWAGVAVYAVAAVLAALR